MIRSLLCSSTFMPISGFQLQPISVLHYPGIGVRSLGSFCSKFSPVSSKSPFSMDQALAVNEVQHVELLDATDDIYGGVIVEMDKPMDYEVFVPILRASISYWKQQGKKGVWFKLPIELANLVEAVVKEGFWYHHAEPKYLMLVYWIPEGTHTLPVNATHRVGVGAFVLNDNNEVLVVQEKCGVLKGTGLWKFPTGVVDEGEDICKAAEREVREETGIETEFIEVLAFRYEITLTSDTLNHRSQGTASVEAWNLLGLAFGTGLGVGAPGYVVGSDFQLYKKDKKKQTHQAFFGKSDLFFVCMLKPLTYEISKQELEIEDAQWMKFEDYSTQPLLEKYEVLRYINNICVTKIQKQYSGFSPVFTCAAFSSKRNFFYLNENDLNRQ